MAGISSYTSQVEQESHILSCKNSISYIEDRTSSNPDFVKLAESFGATGYKVKNTQEFRRTLEKARDSVSIPAIIAIDVDYSRNNILLEDSNSLRI